MTVEANSSSSQPSNAEATAQQRKVGMGRIPWVGGKLYRFFSKDKPIELWKGAMSTRRTKEEAKEKATIFLEKFDLQNEKVQDLFKALEPNDKKLITKYMIASVLNIDWYAGKIKKQRLWRAWYFIVSFALLLILPVTLFFLSNFDLQHFLNNLEFQPSNQSLDFAGGVVVILSSIIAFQKAFSSWFKNQLRIGDFWKASSDLKENYLKLEDEYGGRKIVNRKDSEKEFELKEEFKEAVKEATIQCQKIVRAEQETFFNRETLPNIDLASALTAAKTNSTDLISAFRSNTAITREEIDKAERGVKEVEAAIDMLKKRADKIPNELDELKRQEENPDQEKKKQEVLNAELAAVQSSLEELRQELHEKKIVLARKRTHQRSV